MRRRAAATLVPLLAALLQACVYTRQEAEHPAPLPFETRIIPYPLYNGDEGLSINLLSGLRRGANRLPPPVSEAINLEARLATSGTRGVSLAWDAPGRWRDWRFYVEGAADRFRRAPYFGVGNDAEYSDSLVELYGSTYYRYELLRTGIYGAVQRRLGRFRAHLGGQLRHYRVQPLDDSTALAKDVAAGVIPDTGGFNGAEIRAGLLYDTRREEATPDDGFFVEGMVAQSILGEDYRRYLLSAREFFPMGEWDQWVLGFRQTVELASGTLPFYIAYERLTTWYPDDGFGGPTSIRLYDSGRFLANNRSVLSADLRYKWRDIPYPTSPVRLWMLGFADVGRLWNPGETPKLTGLHWSAGVGSRLQIGKGTLFGVDLGSTDQSLFTFAISTSFGF